MIYKRLIDDFRQKVGEWAGLYDLYGLSCYQNAGYQIYRTIVYNEQLDNIDINDARMVLVGDNPGMEEQKNNAYLVGKSGKMASNFFAYAYGYDFYKNIIILNKTPIHTKSTGMLNEVNARYPGFIEETQRYMAKLISGISCILNIPVFVSGFAGCRNSNGSWLKKGRNGYNLRTQSAPFFFEELAALFANKRENLMLFKHFSYGNFSKDLKAEQSGGAGIKHAVEKIGKRYAEELFLSLEM